MSDRLAVFNAGRIEQIGTPAEVYERPATPFVAGFVGTSNLLAATVDGPGRVHHVRVGRDGLVLLAERAPSDRAHVAVRPEKIRLQDPGEPPRTGSATPRDDRRGRLPRHGHALRGRNRRRREASSYSSRTSTRRRWRRSARRGRAVRLTWQPRHTFAIGDGGDGQPRRGGGT